MEEGLKKSLGELGLGSEQIGKLEAEGVLSGGDIGRLTAEEIKMVTGCGLVTAKKVAEAFAPVKKTVETAIVEAGEAAVVEVLPALPSEDKSFIEMLMVPVVPKVSPIDVLGAVRAGIASIFRTDRVPDILLDKIEKYAEAQEEPAKDIFYKILDLITSRSNAEILRVCGVSGRFMSEKRKKAFLAKIDENFWQSLVNFQQGLETWWDLWTGGLQNAGVALLAFKDERARSGDDLFSDLTEAPDSATLRASALAVIRQINRMFAGAGIPVARVLAYENTKDRELLNAEGLPESMGFTNKDQMIKAINQELGMAVDEDYVETEKNVALFILAIMKLSDIAKGSDQERRYVIGLRKLGRLINWEKLGIRAGGPTPGSGSFRGR